MGVEPEQLKNRDITPLAWRKPGYWRIVLGPLLIFWALNGILAPMPPSVNGFERAGQLIGHYTFPAFLFLGGAWLVHSYRKRTRDNPN